MGLDTSHGAWHGAYSAFMRWRRKIAQLGGWPPLQLMEGFISDSDLYAFSQDYKAEAARLMEEFSLPLKWDLNPDRRLIPLLTHSDCDGQLSVEELKQIVPALRELLPRLKDEPEAFGHIGNWHDKTMTFIEGCEEAIAANEPLDFH